MANPKPHVKGLRLGANMATPVDSASLQLDDTTSGMLLNRVTTTQRNAIAAVEGMVVYNVTTHAINVYNGTSWLAVTAA